ncbi:MAG: 23S rRNA (uracil(1939)-C(5))-methyltransferase RlmD [Flammeovirgaceae bacterium]|nr:23S rRNA (uracil(1939)-C(5))-methyltransferase RlmD [Flammeovirgaceae bacterium]MBE63116.1 23S rRNA (uracil(1939)-C(5))-methyltransferase RlmD [Flammeovirgaceae bacterium]MBR10792.1 23S rRNA (uracil(1939)-C(5))-methyltransferase RlmD [Rickettsiales bacterium]
MKTSKVIEKLEITGVSAEGKSVARHENRVLFINQGAPGDVVDVKIVGKKKKFFEAEIVHFHEKSTDRTEPFCEHFGTCGGCKWQHINYESQLVHKSDHVASNLRKISKTDLPTIEPILGSKETTYYRNKLEFTFSNMRWLTRDEIESEAELCRNALGFHIPKRFDKILDIDHCWLQADPSNKIRLSVKEFAEANSLSFFDLREQVGLLRNLIIRTSSTGEIMVIVQFFEPDEKSIKLVMNHLKESFPEITSLLYIVNEKKNETFYNLPVFTYHGRDFIYEEMEGLKFRIGPKSFYQTNSKQAYELYKVTRDFADLQGNELVYDLYTGTGTIANFVAKKAKHVVGVESVEDAIIDARRNSEINGIDNTTFLAGDMKDMFTADFVGKYGKPDVIITDPPRAGMHPKVVEMLNRIKPEKLVYVSCNPATQARDLELLSEQFEVIKIQPVDMFPQTHHVENVMLLKAKG